MKSFGFKRIVVCILTILLLVFITGCSPEKNRVISNLNQNGTEEKAFSSSQKPPASGQVDPGAAIKEEMTGSVSEGSSAGKQASAAVASARQESDKRGNSSQSGSGSLSPKASAGAETKTPGAKGSGNGPRDTGPYKGYKGPVQGEIKYKEGTPAGENSKEYKASGDIVSPYQVNLIVTRDYGHKKIFARNVGLVRDEVGMEIMFRNLDIQTAYGGGFVNAINGLESHYTFFTGQDRKKLDWFYWVNGILAPVGVAEYRPQPGDVIWWDYHDWSMTMFIPAVIGSYPQPFKSGFGGKNPGTVVMYAGGYQKDAEKLRESLLEKGVQQVDIAPYDPAVVQQPKKYYILLGTWQELAKSNDYLQSINTKNKLAGVYAKFTEDKVQILDFKGKAVSTHEHAGAIYAYGASIGSLNPIWLVTGTDVQGYQAALDTLLHNPGQVSGYFGAIITKDGVRNIPYGD